MSEVRTLVVVALLSRYLGPSVIEGVLPLASEIVAPALVCTRYPIYQTGFVACEEFIPVNNLPILTKEAVVLNVPKLVLIEVVQLGPTGFLSDPLPEG